MLDRRCDGKLARTSLSVRRFGGRLRNPFADRVNRAYAAIPRLSTRGLLAVAARFRRGFESRPEEEPILSMS